MVQERKERKKEGKMNDVMRLCDMAGKLYSFLLSIFAFSAIFRG